MIPPNKKKKEEAINELGQENLKHSYHRRKAMQVLMMAKALEDSTKPIKVISNGKVRYLKSNNYG